MPTLLLVLEFVFYASFHLWILRLHCSVKLINSSKILVVEVFHLHCERRGVRRLLHVDIDFLDFTSGLKFLYTKFNRENVIFDNSLVNLVDVVYVSCLCS